MALSAPGMRPPDLPGRSVWLPALTVRALVLLLGIALTFVVYANQGWIAVGILLTFVAAWEPRALFSWVMILFLAIGWLSQRAQLDWQFLVLLAGVHLLHVASLLALELPWRSLVSARVFGAPLARFVAIQIPCQALAVAALLLLAPGAGGHRPVAFAAAAIAGVIALIGLALLLLRPPGSLAD